MVTGVGGGVEAFSDGMVAASTGCGGRVERSSAVMWWKAIVVMGCNRR